MSDSDEQKSSFLKGIHSITSWLEFVVLPATFMGAYFFFISLVLDIPSDQQGIYYLLGVVILFFVILVAVVYNIDKDYKEADEAADDERTKQINALKGAIIDVSKRVDQIKSQSATPHVKLAGDTFTLGKLDPSDHVPRKESLIRAYEMYFDGTGNILIEFSSVGNAVETWIVDKWHFDRNQFHSQYLHHLDESNSSSIPLLVGGKEPFYLIFVMNSQTFGAKVDFTITTMDKITCLAMCSAVIRE